MEGTITRVVGIEQHVGEVADGAVGALELTLRDGYSCRVAAADGNTIEQRILNVSGNHVGGWLQHQVSVVICHPLIAENGYELGVVKYISVGALTDFIGIFVTVGDGFSAAIGYEQVGTVK